MMWQRNEAVEGGLTLFVPDLTGGGAERVMLTLAGCLSRYGPVDLLLVRRTGSYLSSVPASVRLVDLGARSMSFALPRLVRYLRRARPRAVLSTLPHANLALVCARWLARTRTRIYLREATTPSFVEVTGVRSRLMPFLMKSLYRHADGVVAVSSGVARDLETTFHVPPAHLHVIYNPIVASDLRERCEEALDDRWFEPGAPPVVLAVGRLSPEKGHAMLLRAFARLKERVHARLLILGEGPERPALERLASEFAIANDVRLDGFVPDPFPYMARAAVFALPSEREGLPGAMIQAMACDCPVVSTNCPTGPAEVLGHGRFGKLVPVGDDEAMAAALADRIASRPDPRPARDRSGEFSVHRSVSAYARLLLQGAPPPRVSVNEASVH